MSKPAAMDSKADTSAPQNQPSESLTRYRVTLVVPWWLEPALDRMRGVRDRMKLRHIRMRPVPPRMQLSKLRMELVDISLKK